MREWISKTITTNRDANEMLALVEKLQPKVGAFDTETTGLHIILDRPFLFQFGFLHPTQPIGYTFAVDMERQPLLSKAVIEHWHKYAEQLELYLAHNVKFDLHMLINAGIPYKGTNLSDAQFYIRHAHDHRTVKFGGPPLALKEYCARYVVRNAKDHDKLIQEKRADIAKTLNAKLKNMLSKCGKPSGQDRYKSYTVAYLKEVLEDKVQNWQDLPDKLARDLYCDWLAAEVPASIRSKVLQKGLVDTDMIPYTMVPRDITLPYAHLDIVYVLETWELLDPIVTARDTRLGIEVENKLIYPLLEMERVGFNADSEYLSQAEHKVKQYIIRRRQDLETLVGEPIKVTQRNVILEKLNELGCDIEDTKDETIEHKKTQLRVKDSENPAIEIISLIQELRTLEKWYSTYIQRFQLDLQRTNRLYTTIHQVGAVTGRVTSDFQQFPQKAIRSVDGDELFHPRQLVKVDEGFPAIVYLDFSQIELRFQAIYTLLVGHPDLNLCRAYMPYKCVSPTRGLFDVNNPEHIKAWAEDWYYEEDLTRHWEPTDVHGVTTTEATGLQPGDEGFSEARSKIGKRTNFAKNYGAKLKRIWAMFPDKSEEEARRIDKAYYLAFPGVKKYHDYCYQRAEYFTYTANLYGIKCYGVAGHNLINMLVQGSAAYYLKYKILELYEYSKKHGLKTKWQMQIHDELSWLWNPEDDPAIFFEFKRIMEDWQEGPVPVVAEMEVTKTTWAEKKKVNSIADLQTYLSD